MTPWVLFALVASDPASADIFDILEEEAAVVVSTGSARRVTAREAPGSVWIIDRKTIEASAAVSLYDLLRMLPGMMTDEIAAGQTESALRFPGSFPENQTLVLIDGRNVLFQLGGIYDRYLIDINDVERVEIVFGPASTLYGANAFSGVINVITRRPEHTGDSAIATASGGFGAGSLGERPGLDQFGALAQAYVELRHGWTSGGLRLSAGVAMLPGFDTRSQAGVVLRSPTKKLSVMADLDQDVGAWSLRAQASLQVKDSLFSLLGTGPTQQQDYAVRLLAKRPGLAASDDELTIDLSARYYQMNYRFELPPLAETRFTAGETTTEARVLYAVPEFLKNRLTVGTQLRFVYTDTPTLAPRDRAQFLAGVFVEDHFRPVEPLIITAGMRIDTREAGGLKAFSNMAFNPRAAIVWLITPTQTLRAEYSTAFRIPTAFERAGEVVSQDGVLVLQGTHDLKNEVVHAASLAWTGTFAWFRPRVEAFFSYTINNISPALIRATEPDTDFQGRPFNEHTYFGYKLPLYYQNLDHFFIPGALVKLDFAPSRYWRAYAHYTFFPVGTMHVAGVAQQLEKDGWLFSTQLQLVDEQQGTRVLVAGRVVINAKLGYAFGPGRVFRAFAAGTNLADIRFFHSPAEGRQMLLRDDSFGGRVGPRVFFGLEYQSDGFCSEHGCD